MSCAEFRTQLIHRWQHRVPAPATYCVYVFQDTMPCIPNNMENTLASATCCEVQRCVLGASTSVMHHPSVDPHIYYVEAYRHNFCENIREKRLNFLPSIQFQMHYKSGIIQSDRQRVKCFMDYRGGKIKCFKKKYSEYDGGLDPGLWNLKTSC